MILRGQRKSTEYTTNRTKHVGQVANLDNLLNYFGILIQRYERESENKNEGNKITRISSANKKNAMGI